jgi:hypothetical protein
LTALSAASEWLNIWWATVLVSPSTTARAARASGSIRNEWEALKARNLHDDVNSMLTAFWQDEAHKEGRKKRMEQIYIGRFGDEDYAEIERIRAWLGTRQNKQELLAYLTDKDPFDV